MTSMAAELSAVLGGIIDAAIALTDADFGNIQRLEADGCLRIVAHRGFPDWWIDYWDAVTCGQGGCGTALARGEGVLIEDVEKSPIFVGSPALDVQRRVGVRAVRSIPLRSSTGRMLGMFSTHYREPYRQASRTESVLNLLAEHAATLIEREELAAALQTSEERFQLAMDAAEEGIWDWRLDTGEFYYSPGFAKILGYAPDEIHPRADHIFDLLDPDGAQVMVAEALRRLNDPGHYCLDFRVRMKGGEYCWVRSRGKAVQHDAAGQPVRAIGTCLDVTPSRWANEALRASEARLRLFIEHVPVAVAMVDMDLRYLAVSRRWRDDFGLDDGRDIGKRNDEIASELGERWKAIFRRALAGEATQADEDPIIRADGKVQWLRWEVVPWHDYTGSVGGVLVFSEDITTRKQVEEAIQESEDRSFRAQRAAKVGTWEWDVRTGRNSWSEETYVLCGLTPGTMAPRYQTWLSSICPVDRASVDAAIKDYARQGRDFELEWRTAQHDGSVRWLLSRGQPEMNGKGRLVRYLGIVMDITERKKASQILEKIKNSLADAQRLAHLGSFEYDLVSATMVWSDEQYRIHGLPPGTPPPTLQEVIDRFIQPEDAERLRHEVLDAISAHLDFDQEYRIILPNGDMRWVRTLAHPDHYNDGNALRYFGTTQDITERKREEFETLKQSEQMHEIVRQHIAVQTAVAIAHELNQPLVSISAYNEVALRALQAGNQKYTLLARAVRGSCDQALRAGQVLKQLIGQLHMGDIELKPFDINKLIEEIVGRLRKTEVPTCRIELDLERGLALVNGSRLQTEKVLLNLIQNGVDAMAQAGVSPPSFSISVRSSATRDMAHITVRDGGPGIDPKNAQHIFEPFFSTKRDGLGLGLSISRSLIEAQDGQLWIDPSDGPGAVFHFTLPFYHAPL